MSLKQAYVLIAGLLLLEIIFLLSFSLCDAGTLPAQLDWSNPVDTVDGLQIEKSGTPTGTFTILKQLPAASSTYLDATNNPGDTACYRVAYFNTSGVGPYAGPVCKTFPTVPTQTPGNFTVK